MKTPSFVVSRRRFLHLTGAVAASFAGLSPRFRAASASVLGDDVDFSQWLQPVPAGAVFEDPEWCIWCGSAARGDDGNYHLFYSRWPARLGHRAWVTHSQVARAVADSPAGPYRHVEVVLPARGEEFWDSIHVGGPGQDRTSRFNVYSAFLEHQFSRTTFLELAFNHGDNTFMRYDPRPGGSNSLKGDPQRLLPTGAVNPFAGQLMLESNWIQLPGRTNSDAGRATFSQEFDAGKWGNYRVAALGEYEKYSTKENPSGQIWVDAVTGRAAFNTGAPEIGDNLVWRRNYVREHDWGTYHVPFHHALENVTDPITGRRLSTKWVANGNSTPVYTTKKAMMLAGQARYFRGRLILAGGHRQDVVDDYIQGSLRDPATREWVFADNPGDADPTKPARWAHNVARTNTAGLVYHVTSKLSLFYNRANNLGAPFSGRTVLPPDGTPGNPGPVPFQKGEGEDFGFSLSLLDGRIQSRATYYTTNGRNSSATRPAVVDSANIRILDTLLAAGLISLNESDKRKQLGNQALFDHESQGVELQITANVTRNWRLQANYARTDATQTNRALEWLAWEQQNLAYLKDLSAKNPARNLLGLVTSGARTIADELDFLRTSSGGLEDFTEASGRGKLGNRRHKVSLFTRYNISSGWVKGAYLGGGYRHQSKMFAGLDSSLNKLFTNSYWYADAMAGYQLRPWRNGRRMSFQCNVMNVFDQQDPLTTRYAPNLAGVLANVVQPPLTWRFTTNLDF